MAAPGTVTQTEAATQWLLDSTGLAAQTTYKVALVTSAWTPNMATQSVWADVSANEVANGSGYTTGGNTMSSPSVSHTGGVGKFTGAVPQWTASGGPITARYAVCYALGTFNGHVNPILFYFLLDSAPADVVTADGNSLLLNQPTTPQAAWFYLTKTP